MQDVSLRPRSADERRRELQEVEDLAASWVIATVIRYRTRLFVLPVVLVTAVVFFAPNPWRFILIAFAVTSMAALGAAERARRSGAARGLLLPVWFAGTAQIAVVLVLGGIGGPLTVALPLIALVMNLVAPGRQAIYFVLLLQVPAVWFFAVAQAHDLIPGLVPEVLHGVASPPGTPGPGPWISATFLTVILLVGAGVGRLLRELLMDLLRDQLEDRDRQLEAYEESARSLSQMTAEIAHELKNPLASIKGIAALVEKDLSGKTAERMHVLRREVDRLQAILEEFLSHSRPLLPLAEEPVHLGELVAEVLELHEGVARQRGVRLVAPTAEADVRCDPRKIKQVLINLVQNAIEASPRGTEVRVELEHEADGARVRVLDQGSGLAPGASERLFTVGFTTKDEGSGIGLALARGLARQHGGELALEDREGARGCVATLTLPEAPNGGGS